MKYGIKKTWMLFGIAMARLFPFLHRAKMAVGDAMVLSCTLTMPKKPDGSGWPGGRLPLLVMFRPPKGFGPNSQLMVADPQADGSRPDGASYVDARSHAMPLYGGAAYVFVTDNFDARKWYIVRCTDGARVVEADAVVSKIDKGPSGFSMDFVTTDGDVPSQFEWSPAPNPDHWIHFLVVGRGDELMTGIYTRKTHWLYGQFGDLPYYIHDPMSTKPMQRGTEYDLMYHAVDKEGWVSMSCIRRFRT